jgi:hypothetical protein
LSIAACSSTPDQLADGAGAGGRGVPAGSARPDRRRPDRPRTLS